MYRAWKAKQETEKLKQETEKLKRENEKIIGSVEREIAFLVSLLDDEQKAEYNKQKMLNEERGTQWL